MFCRFCRARNITPVKVVTLAGSGIKTAYHCPRCGEELTAYWTKQKKEKKYGYDRA